MKKLALLLLICFSFLAASAQTTPVSPKGPIQASPYHEASTNRLWLFNPTFGWFIIPDSTYIKKFIGADTLRFKAGQFKNIGTSTAVKIALQTDTQKTGHIYYLGFDPTSKNLRYDTTQFGTGGSTIHANNGLSLSGDTVKLGGSITKDTVVTVTANHQFRIGDAPSGNGLYVSRASDSSMNVALGGGSQSSPIYGFFAVGGNGNIDIEAGNGSVDKSIQIDPTPSTGGMSIHDSDHLGLVNAADYSTQIKLHPYALVQTNMLNARADSILTVVGGKYLPLTLTQDTTVNIGNHSLQFISGDSTGLYLNRTQLNFYSQSDITQISGSISSYQGNTSIQAADSISSSGFFTNSNGHGNNAIMDVAENAGNTKQIKMSTSYSGYTPGIYVLDDIDHVGLTGNQVFPLSGSPNQYAQYGKVDSLITAHSLGVSSFNTRTGAVTLLSSDVTSALGFTPENVANKATSFGTINNTLYPSVQAVNTKLGNYVPLVGGVTITGEVQNSYTPLAANDLARLTDLGLVPTVLTGMGVTVSGTTATIASGTYRLNNITYTYAGGTITIPAQDATQYRYSILYITTIGVISITNGALVAADPVVPDFPANSVEVSIIYIPPTGGTVTTGGGGSKSTGTVTVFSFVNANGFTGSVANATTKPALTLTLKTILPSVVAQTGLGTAGTDSVMVKHSGLMQAIAPGYYLAATTASSTYVPLTRTVNGKALSSNITLGLASSDFANQGTTTGLLHGNASGNPSFSQVVNADITNATIDLTTKVTSILPVANGGTGTSTPGIVAGTNVTVSGTWPNQTINASGGSGVTTVGTFSGSSQTNGASISTSTITFGPADGSNPGMVTTGAQTFGGVKTLATPVFTGLPTGSGVASAATASTIMARDTNANTQINNLIENYTTTATAAGTTTLTAASAYQQYFTGTTTQTIVLPVASTLVVGMQYQIINQSTGIVTVKSSGSNTVQAMDGNSSAVFTCILTSGTSAASWSVAFYGPASTSNSGFVTTGTQSISGAKTFTTGLNLTLAQNGKTQMNVSNSSSGAAAEARISVTNNSSGNTVLGVTSSGYTPFGALVANSSYVYSDASAGLVLMSNGASVIFASGGNAEKMRLNSVGRLLVGTSTDNGTDLIQANGTIISGIDGTTQGAVKITGTSGTVSLKTQLATTTYNYNLPVTAGTAGQVQASGGGGSSPMTWVSAPIIQGTADLTAQTAAGNITTFTVGAATATFSISAYVNVTAIATDVIQGQITYTDENSTSQTVNLTNISAIGNSAYSPIIIRAKTGTVITVKTNLSTSGGTITFDAGARITQL